MKMNIKSYLTGILQRNWSFLFLIILLFILSIFGTGFFSLQTFQNILLASCTIMLIGMGETFVMITGGIDLSVAFVTGFATVIAATLMKAMNIAGINPIVIVLSGLAVGVLVCVIPGLVNGYLIAKLNVPPFIATLGMYGIARGVSLIISKGWPIGGQPDLLGVLGNGYLIYYLPNVGINFWQMSFDIPHSQFRDVIPILPYPVILLFILLVSLHFVLSKTEFGLYTYAIGGSKEAAIRAGIKVTKHLIKVYILSAVMAGTAGMVYTMKYASGHANAGEQKLLDSIAGIVIGGVSLMGGKGTIIPGTLIGALIIASLQTGLVSLAVSPFYQFIAVGCIIIIAVIVDQFFPSIYGK